MSQYAPQIVCKLSEDIRLQTEIGAKQSAVGTISEDLSTEAQIYNALLVEGNAKKAVTLAYAGGALPLTAINAFLGSGQLEPAAKLIAALLAENLGADERSEILLTSARLKAYQGQWAECIEQATEALDLEPASLPRTALLMTRSVAWFETFQLDKASKDLYPVSASSAIYPFTVSVIYARCLEIRILALRSRFTEAKAILTDLWLSLAGANRLNPDFLLALARTELFVARAAGDLCSDWAVAAFLISRSLGQELYTGLAALELACEMGDRGELETKMLQSFVDPYLADQPILRKHLKELTNKDHGTTTMTASFMKKALDLPAIELSFDDFTTLLSKNFESFYFSKIAMRVRLQPCEGEIVASKQYKKALDLFSQYRELTKEDFFKKMWDQKIYASHLHDAPIYNVVSRLRKLGFELKLKEGRLSLADLFIVRDQQNLTENL